MLGCLSHSNRKGSRALSKDCQEDLGDGTDCRHSERLPRGVKSKPGRCLGCFSEESQEESPKRYQATCSKAWRKGKNRLSKEVQEARDVEGRSVCGKGHRVGLSLGA